MSIIVINMLTNPAIKGLPIGVSDYGGGKYKTSFHSKGDDAQRRSVGKVLDEPGGHHHQNHHHHDHDHGHLKTALRKCGQTGAMGEVVSSIREKWGGRPT